MKSEGLSQSKKEVKESLDHIEDLRNIQEDKHAKYIYDMAEYLLTHKLDEVSPSLLVKKGGELVGAYAYLLNKASEARLNRDKWEQKRDEAYNDKYLEYEKKHGKVTTAREKAKKDTSKFDAILLAKNIKKNDYENVVRAADKMIAFIQSAIKVQQSEAYRGELDDNAGY